MSGPGSRPSPQRKGRVATKAEKAKIRQAIDMLMENDPRFQEAMILLGSIVGIRFPGMEAALDPTLKSVPIGEVMGGPDRAFGPPTEPTKETP